MQKFRITFFVNYIKKPFTWKLDSFDKTVEFGNILADFDLGRDIESKLAEFPQHISTKIFKTIIDNTCFKCGGIVNKGNALQNTMVTFADFGDDAGTRGSTQARIGIAEPIEVSKCTSCGHSVKYLNPNNHE